ncbi:MAG: D-alanyl-D-alanine carboxypeptidase family protein [Herminiimonas sp.]|nr:D-alanyl-D-alanine carboxypeptidase family protein [Herminiimonas sp.]MDB5855386.1 D-alanyl-D-alanine carboxypeptidase family protein [Herminiimonas sp.]
MYRYALGVFFSIACIAFTAAPASAVETGASSGAKKTGKKHVVKRATRPKQKAASNASLDTREKLVRQVVLVHGKRKAVYRRVAFTPSVPAVPPVLTAGDLAGLNATHDPLALRSNAALVVDQSTNEVLFDKNSKIPLPIASITKLMTSMVVMEAHQDMDEMLTVTEADVDTLKFSHSRLRVGSQLSRTNMLHIALMSSENRAASALGRNYPGGLPAFVAAMNAKAKSLGMINTHYVDSSGLSSGNVASAQDLAKLVMAASAVPLIRQYSTDSHYAVEPGGAPLLYRTSNHLVENPQWEIGVQKTGYISEAGRCLVMQARIDGRPVVMVFLDSKGKESRLADASRVRRWLETVRPAAIVRTAAQQG